MLPDFRLRTTGGTRRRRRARRTDLRPRLETLEDRAVPSTIPVLNTLDSGPGSLRDAITRANALPGPDTITFASAVTGTITLTSALPDLSTDITITGPGRQPSPA